MVLLFSLKILAYTLFMFILSEPTQVLLALGLLFSVASMISYLVQEKELRQKEFLKMMSVTEFDIEVSWFASFTIFNIATSLLCTVISSYLFPYSAPPMLFVFWMMTFLALTLYSAALASFSSTATRAILIGLLFYFIGLFVSLILPVHSTLTVFGIKVLLFHPATIFSYAIDLLGALDDIKLGLTSESVHFIYVEYQCSLHQIFMGYLYCCIFWFMITWYFNRTITPEYGQAAEVWYFPFTLLYWKSFFCRRTSCILQQEDVRLASDVADDVISNNDETPPIETVSASLQKQSKNGESIEVMNLRKDYGDKSAVNGLSLSMYSGQITALLGHNGTLQFLVEISAMYNSGPSNEHWYLHRCG
jgi:ATP-binding cassette, subfamily A (ABC1), member 3